MWRKVVIKDITTPQKCYYITLWNINIKKVVTVWNKYYDNNQSQCIVAMCCGDALRYSVTFNQDGWDLTALLT